MSEDLIAAAREYAVRMMERLALIVPTGDIGLECEAVERSDGLRMTIATAVQGGLVLTIDGDPRLQLEVDQYLFVSPDSGNVATERSSFLVRVVDEPRPMFTLDYVRGARANTPAAHYNFHFEHDEVVQELLLSGSRRRGKLHKKNAMKGKSPKLGDLHFPVGGHRFRPCLEDVLELLWSEFGIDVRSETAQDAISAGRAEWRQFQLKAAVADDPMSAIEELERLGFTGSWSEGVVPRAARIDRVTAM